MSEIAIRVENLSKLYRIGQREPYHTLRDRMSDFLTSPFRHLSSLINSPSANGNQQFAIRNPQSEFLWALKDISFEIKRGEVVGIIGRNGAGKSTLLKILSRITEPTEGCAEICGRVGSLLEVGTGFHPELTGRENIYLNGAILGMKRAEIDHKFDEIVAFAEVERFINTPVKHYSSGMYLRLAFSVAAHLDPEILLVDEVLAVGDVGFQEKCLGKMSAVSREGRTVLFVSHNMSAVVRLCSRVLLVDQGKITQEGMAQEVVPVYLASGTVSGERVWTDAEWHPMPFHFLPVKACIRNSSGEVTENIFCNEPVVVEFDYMLRKETLDLRVGLMVFTALGEWVFLSYDSDDPETYQKKVTPAGRYRCTCRIPANFLNEGRYVVGLYGGAGFSGVIWEDYRVLNLSVVLGGGVGSQWSTDQRLGPVRPLLEWETCKLG